MFKKLNTRGKSRKCMFVFQNLASPHDIAVSLTGDAIYVAEITPGKGAKLQKYDVMAEDSNDLDSP